MSDRRGGGDGQLWQHAVALYRTGRWHDALACCRELIATAPPKAEVLALPGMLVLHLDHPVSAVDFLADATCRSPMPRRRCWIVTAAWRPTRITVAT
jgi:hypothetical protein